MAGTDSQKVAALVRRLLPPKTPLEAAVDPGFRAESLDRAGRARRKKPPAVETVMEKIAEGKDLSRDEVFVAESIILPDLRPALEVVGDSYAAVSHPLWARLNDPDVKARLEPAIRAVGRIEADFGAGPQFIGTGFAVSPTLIMTNRHVAQHFVLGVGRKSLFFTPGSVSGMNFLREQARPDPNDEASVGFTGIAMIHPYFDMALMRVEALPPGAAPLELARDPQSAVTGTAAAVIGYPGRNDAENTAVQEQVVPAFDVKRLQPGLIGTTGPVLSFNKLVDCHAHDSSTLTGNSGSALVSLDTGRVIGLHFFGLYREWNWAVRASDLALDSRIADAGVRFDEHPVPSAGAWDAWWQRISPLEAAAGVAISANTNGPAGTVRISVPIELTLHIGQPITK